MVQSNYVSFISQIKWIQPSSPSPSLKVFLSCSWNFTPGTQSTMRMHTVMGAIIRGAFSVDVSIVFDSQYSIVTEEKPCLMVYFCPYSHCCHMVSLLKHRPTSCPNAGLLCLQNWARALQPQHFLPKQPEGGSLIQSLEALWVCSITQTLPSVELSHHHSLYIHVWHTDNWAICLRCASIACRLLDLTHQWCRFNSTHW